MASSMPCSPIPVPRVSFITLGCAKNEVDSAVMRRRLAEAGYSVDAEPESADVIVVNTCSFIQEATEESLDAIFEAASLKRVEAGRAFLVVAGCMPARYGDDLSQELDEAAAFVPCSKEDDIVAIVEGLVGRPDPVAGRGAEACPAPENMTSPFSYVKISDGCDRFCSYCTIPFIRGRYHSFPYEQILDEVRRCVEDEGSREIVLIAQDTGRWGQDLADGHDLAWLVDTLAGQFADTWFRVMYLQPEGVTDRLLEVMAARDNVCSYLDIPLQHVSEPILRAMNRPGGEASFARLVEQVRSRVPDITLRTTLIAGFPGETEEQFEMLCDFVAETPFDYVGVFPYSREEGTAAFDLEDQIDEDEKLERAQRLRDVADAACGARIAARAGSTMKIVVEGYEEDGQRYGRAQCQAPDVDGVTYVNGGEPGEIVSAVIEDTLLYEMEGSLLP